MTRKPGAIKRLVSLTEAVNIPMNDPYIMKQMAQAQKDQMREVFETEGSTVRGGRWAALNPRYAARKRAAGGHRRILDLTGETRGRFIGARPGFIARFIPKGGGLGVFQFGAASQVAAAHRAGNAGLAPRPSGLARKVFGGIAKRLPIRDMLTKTERQILEFRRVLKDAYLVRLKQALRGVARLGGRT